MDNQTLSNVLLAMIGLCVVLSIVNFLRIRKKKATALLFGFGFLLFAVIIWGYEHVWPNWAIYGMGFILFLLLVVDAALKMGDKAPNSKK